MNLLKKEMLQFHNEILRNIKILTALCLIQVFEMIKFY